MNTFSSVQVGGTLHAGRAPMTLVRHVAIGMLVQRVIATNITVARYAQHEKAVQVCFCDTPRHRSVSYFACHAEQWTCGKFHDTADFLIVLPGHHEVDLPRDAKELDMRSIAGISFDPGRQRKLAAIFRAAGQAMPVVPLFSSAEEAASSWERHAEIPVPESVREAQAWA
jgi:hypothetical protein